MSHIFAAGLALLLLTGCQQRASEPAPPKTLHAFEDDARLEAFFKKQPAAPAPVEAAAPAPADALAGSDSALTAEHGKHLVLLRHGRLFTVEIGKDQLKPVAALDAFAPGAAALSRYDALIVSEDTLAVIGYSEAERGTGINLFDIDAGGRLAFRAGYLLRAGDGAPGSVAISQADSKLVLYAARAPDPLADDPLAALPALRAGPAPAPFARIAPASRVYRLDAAIDSPLALHSVIVCDLAARVLRCDASAVLAPRARAVHMASQALYVWTLPYAGEAGAGLVRMPFNGGAPGAVRVAGAPHDPFSFYESADAHLNVLVGADGATRSWRGEAGPNALALLRLPLQAFSDGSERAPMAGYKDLPDFPPGPLRNRFIGPWLVYGGAASGADGRAPLYALRWDGSGGLQRLQLGHPVERIAAMGVDAVVAGQARSALHLSSIRLGVGPDQPATVASTYVHPNAQETPAPVQEPYYAAQRPGQGMLSLAIVEAGQPDHVNDASATAPADAVADAVADAASVLYLRNTALKLRELGALKAQHDAPADQAAWYGNARPLFVQGRMFALLGDELVEGKLKNGRLREARRINYAPAAP
ncbi:hypothetical protein [Massilia aquatica]|uniref:Lipoprotein n=1 Tax=Massilia aquatica TaxID=2609000 RepID=A0ABX0M465_9BURK|nr:hypothetical protein [Massilia aquatica]NHZ38956.1 hypothetical protein [Massilia aquatica]